MDNDSDRDRALDETLEETFPASDAPANTVETGIRLDVRPAPLPAVMDNTEAAQFELAVDGEIATLAYERTAKSLILIHTHVPASLRGRHIGDALAKTAIETAHNEGREVIVICSFVKAYLRRQAEHEARADPDPR